MVIRKANCPNKAPSNIISQTEIASSRKGMSPIVAHRKYHFTQIYASNSPATDLAVLGKFEISFKDGSSIDLDFTARFIVAEEGRLKSVEVFTDGGATKAAYEKATKALAAKEKEWDVVDWTRLVPRTSVESRESNPTDGEMQAACLRKKIRSTRVWA